MPTSTSDAVQRLIRDTPDFPKPGILFRDLTPALADGQVFAAIVREIADRGVAAGRVDAVAGVEARGFLLASAVALRLECGVVPVRKSGKLPPPTVRESYDLEYGDDELEFPVGLLAPGSTVLLVDDVLATGGTLAAAARLVERAGLAVAALAVVLEIAGLGGRERLSSYPLTAVVPA